MKNAKNLKPDPAGIPGTKKTRERALKIRAKVQPQEILRYHFPNQRIDSVKTIGMETVVRINGQAVFGVNSFVNDINKKNIIAHTIQHQIDIEDFFIKNLK